VISAESGLEELEHAWMEAVRTRDLDTLEALLAPEFTLTTGRPGDEIRGRAEYLAVTRDQYVAESFAFDEIVVLERGEAAVVRSRLRQVGRMGAENRTQPFFMTDVWFSRDGRWEVVSRHLSPLPPTERPLRIDHCVIAISDWKRSNAFYHDVLGAEVEQRDRWFAHYRFDGWMLNVHGPGFHGLNAEHPVEPGGSDLCFAWPGSLDDAVGHLRRHEVELVPGPAEVRDFGGGRGRSVYFRDPDGSLLELVALDGG